MTSSLIYVKGTEQDRVVYEIYDMAAEPPVSADSQSMVSGIPRMLSACRCPDLTIVAGMSASLAVTSPINENDMATLTGTIVDDPGDTHTVVITWGPNEGMR